MEATAPRDLVGDYQFGFSDEDRSVFQTARGLREDVVRQISEIKGEPAWMLEFRLKSLQMFRDRPMPRWGNSKILDAIDFERIIYYVRPA